MKEIHTIAENNAQQLKEKSKRLSEALSSENKRHVQEILKLQKDISKLKEEILMLTEELLKLNEEVRNRDEKITELERKMSIREEESEGEMNQLKEANEILDIENSRIMSQLNEEKVKWAREKSRLNEEVIKLKTEMRLQRNVERHKEDEINKLNEKIKLIQKGLSDIITTFLLNNTVM